MAGFGCWVADALARANEVLVSSTLRDLVIGSRLEFGERGSYQLNGVPGEWRLFAVAPGCRPGDRAVSQLVISPSAEYFESMMVATSRRTFQQRGADRSYWRASAISCPARLPGGTIC